MGESNDKAAPAAAVKKDDAAVTLSQQSGLLDRMHLKDPGKLNSVELLNPPDFVHLTAIDPKLSVSDPHKFLSVASDLAQKAPGGNLTIPALEQISSSPNSTADQKAVAVALKEDYLDLATDDPHSIKRFLKYTGFPMGQRVREEGIAEKQNELAAAEMLAKHPEINSPQVLAAELATIFKTVAPFKQSVGFGAYELANIAASSDYTDAQRAAAELVKLNFDKFATLSGNDSSTFNIRDLMELAKIGLPPGTQLPEACSRTSPAANAAEWGLGVGAVSKASGSDQSFLNAMVAATSAVVAAEIKNDITCPE